MSNLATVDGRVGGRISVSHLFSLIWIYLFFLLLELSQRASIIWLTSARCRRRVRKSAITPSVKSRCSLSVFVNFR